MKNFMLILIVVLLGTNVFGQVPSNPTPIDGPFAVCHGEEVVFSLSKGIDNAEKTIWSVSPGMIILSGWDSKEIVVYIDSMYTTGSVSVQGWNREYHFGMKSTLVVDVRDLPLPPPPIIGDTNVVVGQKYVYEIHDIIGMGPYIWTVPSWMTIVEGQETNTLVVEVSEPGALDLISVVRTNECGSSEPVYLKVSTATGLNEFDDYNIKFYPNPTKDCIYFENLPIGSEIQIFDLNGKLLSKTEQTKVELFDYVTGMYIFDILYQGNVIKRGKIIKQ